jgi:molecular chaperone GrpE
MSGERNQSDAGVAAASEAAAPSEEQGLDGIVEGPGEPASQNHEPTIQLDLDELVTRAEKADEYLDLAQRTKADFENYRKRTARDAAVAQTRGASKLALGLLPAIDNLDRALAAASTTDAGELAAGIKLVHDEILAAFFRAGIEPFSPEGEPFDPQQHEAVAQQPAPEADPGTIVEVYQRGYRLGDAVLRPARVSVAG